MNASLIGCPPQPVGEVSLWVSIANQPGFCNFRIAEKPERQRKFNAGFLCQLTQALFISKRAANNGQFGYMTA
jgi:hypothetical protein